MDFKKALPIIIALRNSNLKPRHFSQIKFLIGHDLVTDKEKITMSVLLNTDVSYNSIKVLYIVVIIIIKEEFRFNIIKMIVF